MRNKSFAIIDVKSNSLHTMVSAADAEALASSYPFDLFRIYDMTGRDDVPYKDDIYMSDITVEVVDDVPTWVYKITDEEASERKKTKNAFEARRAIIRLTQDLATAQSLGFTNDAENLSNRITALQAHLARLLKG